MKMLKKTVKKIFRLFGVDIRKYHSVSTPTTQLVSALRKFEIDLVLDVGANAGQFASEIRDAGYEGKIISFEPLSNAYDQLQKRNHGDHKWIIHPRCAIGDRNGEVEINIAANSTSSSLLPMLESHLSAAPYSAYVGREMVPLKTLDSAAFEHVANYKRIFLKIDTQGFEWEVLNGAQQLLPHVQGVLLELSLFSLYGGQRLWQDLIKRLEQEGFVLWALQPGFIDPYSFKTLQVDGIFFRE